MQNNHRSVFKKHVGYVNIDIQKPFKVGIIHYDGYLLDMLDMNWYLYQPYKNSENYYAVD